MHHFPHNNNLVARPVFLTVLFAFCLLTPMQASFGQVPFAGWEINGVTGYGPSPFLPTVADASVSTVGLTRGNGIATTGSAAGNAWGGANFTETSSAAAIASGDFVTISLSINPGYEVSMAQIPAYNVRRSSSGPTTGQWQYSINGGEYVDIGTAITWGTVTNSAGNLQTAIPLSGIASLQNMSAGTQVTFRLAIWGGSSAGGTWYINNFQTGNDFLISGFATPVQTSSPLIEISPSALTGFEGFIGLTGSQQFFDATGVNLTGDIQVSAPADFEISLDEVNFGPSLTISQSSGSAGDRVYVRLADQPTTGPLSGAITLSSLDATTRTVVVTGTRYLAPPSFNALGDTVSESFSGFVSFPTLPPGIVVSNQTYGGTWGSIAGAGLLGEEAVVGFQHTGSTGLFTVSYLVLNNTGEILQNLQVSYTGRVSRVNEGRSPSWTVKVNGVVVPELAYSTASSTDTQLSAVISGLNIPDGETVQIEWTSDGSNEGSPGGGSRRQIGISNLSVSAIAEGELPPIFSLIPGTYFSNQVVTIANAEEITNSGAEIRYTLDGTNPTSSSQVYNPVTGILLIDGSGPIILKAARVQGGAVGTVAVSTYTFPVNVQDIPAFRNGSGLMRILGEVTILHRDSFRNRHFARDASGALTIWDDNTPQNLTTQYNLGDNVAGFVGTRSVTNSGALIYLSASADPGAAVSSNNPAQPLTKTVAELTPEDTGNLVILENVSFETAGDPFATGTNYTVLSNGSTIVFRTDFFSANYIGEIIPSDNFDLVGIVSAFGSNLQITARSLADLGVIITPTLTVSSTSTTLTEGGSTATVTITRNGDFSSDLEVTLSESPAGVLEFDAEFFGTYSPLPGLVVIPAGSDSAFAEIRVLDNEIFTDDYIATLTASATGFVDGILDLTILDDEQPVGSTFFAWSGGLEPTAELVEAYAIGGASGPGEAGEAPVVAVEGDFLTLTAIVRTDDPDLTIAGVATSDLTVAFTTTGVTSTTAGVSQDGVPAGTERRKYSVPLEGADKKFLRLIATLDGGAPI